MKNDYQDFNNRANKLLEMYLGQGLDLEPAGICALVAAKVPVAPRHADDVLITPNALLRCPLFRVAQSRAERKRFHRHHLPLQGSREGYVEYTGEELRQSDGDVFMALLKKEQKTPGLAVVKLRQFAQKLGWGNSNDAVQRLEDSIVRLSATNVEINSHFSQSKSSTTAKKFSLSLVVKYEQEEPGVWLVYLDSKLRDVRKDMYTRIKDSHLAQLSSGAALASWLLKYFSTHREPMPITFYELRRFCGAASVPKEFKRLAISALQQLQKIGFLESFACTNESLSVVRMPIERDLDADDDSAGDTP